MYALFFLAAILGGLQVAWAGNAVFFGRIWVLAVAAVCVLYGLGTVNVYVFAMLGGQVRLTDFIPWGFVNIRFWSQVATWCLPLMPLAVLVGPWRHLRVWRVAVLLGAGIWWWILFITTGRGSILGIAFGLLVVMLLLGKKALPWFKVLMQHLTAGVVIWLLLSVLVPAVLTTGGIETVSYTHLTLPTIYSV